MGWWDIQEFQRLKTHKLRDNIRNVTVYVIIGLVIVYELFIHNILIYVITKHHEIQRLFKDRHDW